MLLFHPAVFLLGCVEQTVALALAGWQEPDHDVAKAAVAERDFKIAVITSRLPVIYSLGDPSMARSAGFGFEFRIDYTQGIFGLCASTVGLPDCGLVGNCVDKFSCEKGCGFTGTDVRTVTCTSATAAFCSKALLTPATGVEPVTYLACAELSGAVDLYSGFTLSVQTTTSPTRAALVGSGTSTTPPSTASGAQTPTPTSSPSGTEPLLRSSPTAPTASDPNNGGESTSNLNLGAIIGGAVGCMALLCGFSIVALWLVRRNRRGADNDETAPSGDSTDDTSSREYIKPELEAHVRAELSGRGPAAYDTGSSRVEYPPMTPVELPAAFTPRGTR
ncbi:hypothetical protein VTI74DRAFT_2705 [Chaetomium olivicolor]